MFQLAWTDMNQSFDFVSHCSRTFLLPMSFYSSFQRNSPRKFWSDNSWNSLVNNYIFFLSGWMYQNSKGHRKVCQNKEKKVTANRNLNWIYYKSDFVDDRNRLTVGGLKQRAIFKEYCGICCTILTSL